MSKEQEVVTLYSTGPADFHAFGYAKDFRGALAAVGIPCSETIDEAKGNDPDWKSASFVKITFEVINPDDEPAHEHLKETSND